MTTTTNENNNNENAPNHEVKTDYKKKNDNNSNNDNAPNQEVQNFKTNNKMVTKLR